MAVSERLALLAAFSGVMLATAAVFIALDDRGLLGSIPETEETVEEAPQPAREPAAGRASIRVAAVTPVNVPGISPARLVPPVARVEPDPIPVVLRDETPAVAEEPAQGAAAAAPGESNGETGASVGAASPVVRAPAAAGRAQTPLPSQHKAIAGKYSLEERLALIAPGARHRLEAKFAAAKVAYPPHEVIFLAIKDDRLLELFARSESGQWQFVHRYSVLAASGGSGPKLKHGDKQVPEGIYGIEYLNPNSRYHVSLKVDYPNAFDREMASRDGRTNLGGDIMIHGKNASVGCLAVGDTASEEVFVLAADVGLPKVKVVIAPTDFRAHGVPAPDSDKPGWVPKLYTEVASTMSELKSPPRNILLSLFGKW